MSFPTAPLGSLCEVLDRFRKPITKSARTPGEYPYYGATGIVDYVDGYLFDEPLVLLGEDGAKWGPGEESAFAASGRYWVNNHAHIVRPNRTKLLDDWLIFYLNWQDLSPFITGLTVPKLNQERMREIPIPLPPLQEQQRIVAVLDDAFEAIATATANAERNLVNAGVLGQRALHHFFQQHANDWEDVEICDVADVESGAGFPEHLQGMTDEVYPFFKVGDMNTPGNEVIMTLANHTISEATRGQLRARIFPVGSVVFPKVGGAIATDKKRLIGRPCCVDNNVMGIIPKPDRLDATLLHQLLINKPLSEFANDAGLPSIRKRTVEKWRARLPRDLQTQELVAQRLSEIAGSARELIETYAKKRRALSDLKQSLLQRAFSGELTERESLAA